MSKIVYAEQNLFNYLENSSLSISQLNTYSVGLILGQKANDKYYVIHLSRTPPLPASKDVIEEIPISLPVINHNLNIKSISCIDDVPNNWVANHAKCVTRMLPGGMDVLGLFIIGPNDTINHNDSFKKLKSIIMIINRNSQSNPYLYGNNLYDYLIFTFDYTSKRYSCKLFDINSERTMKNIEWKFQSNITTWYELETHVNFNQLLFPITNEKIDSNTLKQRLEKIVENTSNQIQSAVILIEGKNISPDKCINIIANKKKNDDKESKIKYSNFENEVFQADIYIKYPSTNDNFCIKFVNCDSLIRLMGQMISKIFVNEKSTMKETFNAIKQDVIRSLASRLEMHSDSLIEEENNLPEDNITLHEPPRRVLVALPQKKLTLSDYLFPGEGPQEALISIEELLDLQVNENNVLTEFENQVDPIEFYNHDQVNNDDIQEKNIINNNYSFLYITGLGLIIAFIILIIATVMN